MSIVAGDSGDGQFLDGVVDEDGNIVVRAELLPSPMKPGDHLRLVLVPTHVSLFGTLPDLPDLTWEDFEEASRAAAADAEASVEPS